RACRRRIGYGDVPSLCSLPVSRVRADEALCRRGVVVRGPVAREVFLRRAPEGLKVVRRSAWQADLYDIISAYGIIRARTEPSVHVIARRPVMTLDEAIHRLERMIGTRMDWTALEAFLPETQDREFRKSALASSFVATLELARLGKVALQQEGNFTPLYVRAA